MNEQVPLRLTENTGTAALTPAGLQRTGVIFQRRLLVGGLNVATIAVLAYGMARVLGDDGWSALDIGIYASFVIGTPWTVVGFWNAVIGFWLLHIAAHGPAQVSPFMKAAKRRSPIAYRTAVLMTLRNEDPARAFARLSIVRKSLDETGHGARFDYFVLSDTNDLAVAAEEERLFAEWNASFGEPGRARYRRRERNDGYKAGNLRDFVERWGDRYDLMLPLDADSLMSGPEILRFVRMMQAYPKIGILQSLVVGTPSPSAFARVFQFGMRHAMRSYTMGSAWWMADCGPYWGHNAFIRVAPFTQFCHLPVLPGKAPLGGYVLSHDQIEAVMMRRAGFEVRVAPSEGGSWEDNPPSILEFTKRDLRWCQGNMQYFRLLGLPGLLPLSRLQIFLAILMYLGSLAWMTMIVLSALKVFEGGTMSQAQIAMGMSLFFACFMMSLAPKLAGMLDAAITPGGMARYGGPVRFFAGSFTEISFSVLFAPVASFRVAIFMIGLLFGRATHWNGQQRDVAGLSWSTAIGGLWPQTLFGTALFTLLAIKAPGAMVWAAPLLIGLVFASPFAVLTASPAFGDLLARLGLCAVPEEFAMPIELQRLMKPEAVEIAAPVAADTPKAAAGIDENADVAFAAVPVS
jgi:membrane glycosyltransferase